MATALTTVSHKVSVVFRSSPSAEPKDEDVFLTELRDVGLLERLEPVREVKAAWRQRSRARRQPVVTLDRVVVCESRLEALRVMELDRTGSLAWIVAQPFWIKARVNGQLARRHAPDLLYGVDDGSVVLENVRPPERRTPAFEQQEAMCRYVARTNGWSYQTVGSFAETPAAVLNYLWQYAVVEPRDEVVARVAEAFRDRPVWGLEELVERCGRQVVAHPSLMALVWRGELAMEAAAGVHARTPVRLGAGWGA